MKTITIPTTNRLPYFWHCIESLKACPGIGQWKLIVLQDRRTWSSVMTEALVRDPELDVSIVIEDCPTPDEAVYRLHDLAYGRFHSNANLFLCDDFAVTPDALSLCEWWLQQIRDGAKMDGKDPGACLSLCLSCANRPSCKDDVLEVLRWFYAGAFMTTHSSWIDWFARNRELNHMGWDYSINDVLKKHDLFCLFPAVSRAVNIGRCGNAHLTPGQWDQMYVDNQPAVQPSFTVSPEPEENKP